MQHMHPNSHKNCRRITTLQTHERADARAPSAKALQRQAKPNEAEDIANDTEKLRTSQGQSRNRIRKTIAAHPNEVKDTRMNKDNSRQCTSRHDKAKREAQMYKGEG